MPFFLCKTAILNSEWHYYISKPRFLKFGITLLHMQSVVLRFPKCPIFCAQYSFPDSEFAICTCKVVFIELH